MAGIAPKPGGAKLWAVAVRCLRKDAFGNKIGDGTRFTEALSRIGGHRLTYTKLTGKDQSPRNDRDAGNPVLAPADKGPSNTVQQLAHAHVETLGENIERIQARLFLAMLKGIQKSIVYA